MAENPHLRYAAGMNLSLGPLAMGARSTAVVRSARVALKQSCYADMAPRHPAVVQ